jgi:hypothetical protein
VARGTPELLAALGLEGVEAELAGGRAIALDPSTLSGGKVSLVVSTDDADRRHTLPAVAVDPRRVPFHLPAVLVPPDIELAPTNPQVTTEEGEPDALVVRLTQPASPADLATLRSVGASGIDDAMSESFAVQAWAGHQEIREPFESGRLDDSRGVGIRRPRDVRVAVGSIAVIATIGLLVALRLAAASRQADEDVIEMVGADRGTIRRLVALQAAVLTALATSLGRAVGIGLTRLGLARYNVRGRFGSGIDGTDLPPIPAIVPPVLLAALAAVPLGAALVAWLLALRRRPPGPTVVADGLLW